MNSILINGLVASQSKEPRVEIAIGEAVTQLSIAEARKVAADIVQMAARTEADAMIHRFLKAQQFPEGANIAVMLEFRKFRLALDAEAVEGFQIDPDRKADPFQ
jgi:hypothetical protein